MLLKSQKTARRLLIEFERAGLVVVDRQRGRGPKVTLTTPAPEITTDE